jgi:hypothetical protein
MRKGLILLLACVFCGPLAARSWTYRSGTSGTLQHLIGRAAAGDTIIVEGTVNEGSVHVD